MDFCKPTGPAPFVIFLFAVIIILSHVPLYGWTFDEARIVSDGLNLMRWVRGEAETEDVWFGSERPSPVKVLAAAGIALFGLSPSAVRFFPAMLYALAVTVVYATLRKPRGPLAAFAASGALLLAPPLFGFSAQASNESVVTALTLIILCRSASALTSSEWMTVGALSGIAVGTKVTGVIVVFSVILAAVTLRRRVKFSLVPGFLLGYLLTWPVIIAHPMAVLDHLRHFESIDRPPLLYMGGSPAWNYSLVWLGIGLPSVIVLPALIELVIGRGPFHRFLACYIGIGLVVSFLAHDYLREGLRHLLPVAAVLAVCAGLALGRLVWARRRLGVIAFAIFFAPLIWSVQSLHPADAFFIEPLASSYALRANLPVTSSGDLFSDDLLRRLPEGVYAVIPGRRSDRPLNFANVQWRTLVSERATRLAGRPITFTSADIAHHALVLGSGKPIGSTLLERNDVVYVSYIPVISRAGFAEDFFEPDESLK